MKKQHSLLVFVPGAAREKGLLPSELYNFTWAKAISIHAAFLLNNTSAGAITPSP